MRKIIIKSFIIFLIIESILAGFIIYKAKADIQLLVNIKYMLFTDFTSERALFELPPWLLDNTNFQKDPAALVESWKYVIMNNVDYMHDVKNKNIEAMPDVEKAKKLVLLFSKNGGGICRPDLNLLEKIKKLPEGNGEGCCTDHSEVFLALGSVFGLKAREVHTVGHVTNEFYDHTLNKWIWIDPSFALMATNDNGEYLSLIEIRDLYFENKTVNYEFFGGRFHYFSKHHDPHKFDYFDSREKFSNIMVTWGINVFTEDNINQKLQILPRYLKQFVSIKSGMTPSYIMYLDKNNAASVSDMITVKHICNGILGLSILGFISFPSAIVATAFRKKNN